MNLSRSNLSSSGYLLVGACRLWSLAANLVVVFVVSTAFSPIEQGYYYAFQSLGAAQFFFDLGVGFVLANEAGRRVASAQLGGRSDLAALSSVLSFSVRWSCLAALALIGGLFFAGNYLFPEIHWIVWRTYSILVAFNMILNVQFSILEGVGLVVWVSAVRGVQTAIFVAALFISSAHGGGLKSLPFALLISTLFAIVMQFRVLAPVIAIKPSEADGIEWKKDIFPFQWRMAASWISGYFVFQAPVPFLFNSIGPVQAGQMGLTMQIFQALTSLVGVLLSVRIKTWTRLVVGQEAMALRRDLWRVVRWGVGAVILASAGLMLIRYSLLRLSPAYLDRVVDSSAWLWLTVAAAANHLFFSVNYYFRAHGKEPLWTVATLAGAVALLFGCLGLSIVSVANVVIVYTAISVIVHAGGSLLLYRMNARL